MNKNEIRFDFMLIIKMNKFKIQFLFNFIYLFNLFYKNN